MVYMTRKQIRKTGSRTAVDVSPIMQHLPQAAYYLAWIICNGSVQVPTNTSLKWVSVRGDQHDVYMLQKLATFFHATPTVVQDHSGYVLRIRHTAFTEACVNSGLTRYVKERGAVADWLAASPDFWRGVFDSSATYEEDTEDGHEVHVHVPRKLVDQFIKFVRDNKWVQDNDLFMDYKDDSGILVLTVGNSKLGDLWRMVKGEPCSEDMRAVMQPSSFPGRVTTTS